MLWFALLLVTSCGGSGTVSLTPPDRVPEPDSDGPFGEPQRLATFPAGAPFRYDRVDVADGLAVVGVPADPTDDTDRGSVVVHVRSSDGGWAPTSPLRPPAGEVEAFGEHLALDGTTLGATLGRRDPATGVREAVVLLYERAANDEWLLVTTLFEGEGVPPGSVTLALRNDLLAIGTRPSFATSGGAGAPSMGAAVRLFGRDAGDENAWTELDPIVAPKRTDGREGSFGADVELSPDGTLLAVADTAQTSDSGFGTYVYLYERPEAGGAWKPLRTFEDEELPSPYSAMLELDVDTLAVTPMAARETTGAAVAIFGRDIGGPDAWGRAAMVEVEVGTPSDDVLPRHVLLSTDLAEGLLAVGIGPSACIDLRADPGPDPAPCAGGRVHLVTPVDGGGWEVGAVIEDSSGRARSSYGEYVALDPGGRSLFAGGTVLTSEGGAYTHLDVYERDGPEGGGP